MILGFYYHIPVVTVDNSIKIPGYLGLFIDSLANVVERLILFMHEAHEYDSDKCDYVLKSSNIELVTLGVKSPAWERFIWPSRTLNKIRPKVRICDHLLVRAPSPLAPAFYRRFKLVTKIAYLVVGDYVEGSKYLNQPWYRKIPIIILSRINDAQLNSALKHCKTLVNSQKLFTKYKPMVSDLFLVKTTTLTKNDFFNRSDTCQGTEIRLLYTGSISFAKGLRELIDALLLLTRCRKRISLHLVGWDYDPAKSAENFLKNQAENLGMKEKVFFHGYKKIGPDLNEMYRMADLYVIPSYHEGFPRTIWEAMANGLPVIASNVGSIPHYIVHERDALVIQPRDSLQIANNVQKLIDDSNLRQKLIQNGYLLASNNTLEVLTSKLIDIIDGGKEVKNE